MWARPTIPSLRDRPATAANAMRNRGATRGRARRWRPARDALWRLLSHHVPAGASVGIVGSGNAHDLPLTRLLARAGRVDLIDADGAASRRALRAEPRALRGRGRVIDHDVTGGAADRVVRAARAGRLPRGPLAPAPPIPGGPYDVIVGDLLYTQLLYPGLRDAGIADERVRPLLQRYGSQLTCAVVECLHASAPGGRVIHVHDALGWWEGHRQPFTPQSALAQLSAGLDHLGPLVARGLAPAGADPFGCARAQPGFLAAHAAWLWPFAPGVEYLVAAGVFAAEGVRSRP